MTAETTPIVQTHEHVCLIYYGESSRRPVVLQWAREALSTGEGVVMIEPPSIGTTLIDLVGKSTDRLVIVDPDALYGSGDDVRVITERLLAAASSSDGVGPRAAHVSSPAAHAIAVHGEHTHLEYERSFARAVEDHPIAMMCQYDQVSIDDAFVARAAAEHEIVVQLDDLALPTLDLRPTAEGVRISGEIDIANHAVVASWMSRHWGQQPVVVDCSNLTFLDVTGLRALTASASEHAPVIFEHVNGIPATLLSALPLGSMPAHVAIGRPTS